MKLRLLQALIALVMLAALEAAARVAYTLQGSAAQGAKWFVYTADTGWERRPFFSGLDDCGKHREFGRQGLLPKDAARLQEKKPGEFRALFLGDSNTYGYCLEAGETFVEALNRSLPDVVSINLGVPGYSSYQGYRTLEKYGDALKPDLVFISFNYNDRRLVSDPALTDGPAAFGRVHFAGRMERFAEFSYLFRAVQSIAQTMLPSAPASSGFMADARLDTLQPRVSAAAYRQNLENMAAWARQRGIAVAFILLGDNPDQTHQLREGIALLSEGKYEEAIVRLNAAKDEEDDHSFSALARLYLAKAYSAVQRDDDARQALSVKDLFAGLHGGYPIALDTEYYRVLHEVATRHNIPVIDAAAELNKVADVYFDQCHFDGRGQERVSRLLAGAIRQARTNKETKR